ncbi:MAG: ABC transporter substrate-binding protein, partial [Anaerolineales bacterium]|nr:ABC transporter substrate-binding protein [Anaerolineales bacterium]
MFPVTGGGAAYGTEFIRTVTMYVDEYNAKGGIPSGPLKGAKFKWIYFDTQTNPEIALSETERAITEEKVHMVTGSIYSSNTNTGQEAAERYETPWVCFSSSSPALTKKGLKWFFRTGPHDDLFIKGEFGMLKDAIAKTGESVET